MEGGAVIALQNWLVYQEARSEIDEIEGYLFSNYKTASGVKIMVSDPPSSLVACKLVSFQDMCLTIMSLDDKTGRLLPLICTRMASNTNPHLAKAWQHDV